MGYKGKHPSVYHIECSANLIYHIEAVVQPLDSATQPAIVDNQCHRDIEEPHDKKRTMQWHGNLTKPYHNSCAEEQCSKQRSENKEE